MSDNEIKNNVKQVKANQTYLTNKQDMDEQIDFYRRIYLESIWHELYLNAYKYYMAVEAIGRFEGEESFDFYQYLEKFEYSSDRVKQLYQEIVEDEVNFYFIYSIQQLRFNVRYTPKAEGNLI